MKKYTITGFFNVFTSFLEDLEERGIKQDDVLKLYGGKDGAITLIDNGLNVVGYTLSGSKRLVINGRKVADGQFQLYICSVAGNIYTLSVDSTREGVNCAVYFCKYNKDDFDELICCTASVKLKQEEVDNQQIDKIYKNYLKLQTQVSKVYKLHVEGALSSEYFILQDYGSFTDSLEEGDLFDNKDAEFIPIYNICCECLDKLDNYADTLNLKVGESFTVPSGLIKNFAKDAIEKRNLKLSQLEKQEIINLVDQIFEQDDIQSDSITLGTAKVIMQCPLLEERSTVSIDSLIANCIYFNIDDISEVNYVINAFSICEGSNADEIITNSLKNQFEDYQISVFIDCHEVITQYLNHINCNDYQGFLQDIKFLVEANFIQEAEDNFNNQIKVKAENDNLTNEEIELIEYQSEFIS